MPNATRAVITALMPPPAPPPALRGTDKPSQAPAVSEPVCDIIPPSTMMVYGRHHHLFRRFLEGRGAELLAPKNGLILRFRTRRGIGTVFHGPLDLLWWNMEAEHAWQAYRDRSIPWRGAPEGARLPSEYRQDTIRALAQRDGPRCIYCWTPLTEETATIEHFIPRIACGGYHLANLGLACRPCNLAMGHKPIAKKITTAIKGTFR